jgi:hypothetical protein
LSPPARSSRAVIAILTSLLTSRAHNSQEQETDTSTLRLRADAMTEAVLEEQATAAANRLPWEGLAEHAKTFLSVIRGVLVCTVPSRSGPGDGC